MRLAVGAVLLLATFSLGGSWNLTAPPAGAPVTHPAALRPDAGSLCDTLTTNASLVAMVDQHYPNSTLIPAQATARANAQSLWGKVCTSSALDSAEAGSTSARFNASVFEGEKNVTGGTGWISGSLLVWFHAGWNASCPTTVGPYPQGYDCLYSDDWLGNLSTDSLTGPQSQVVSVRLSLCGTLTSNASLVANLRANYPNSNLLPSESIADANIQVAWGNLCASTDFFAAYTGHAGAEFGLSYSGRGAQAPNSTGSNGTGGAREQYLFAEFEILWNAACPNGSNFPSGAYCSDHDWWTTNLSNGVTTGPTFSAYLPVGSEPCAPCTPGPGNRGLVTALAGFWPYLVAGLVIGTVAGFVGFASRRRRRAGPPGIGPQPPLNGNEAGIPPEVPPSDSARRS